MQASISLVFPMYDEEESILPAVHGAREALAEITDDWEIVVVDDGSRDGTGERADALAREDDRIRVVHNDTNLGLGGALRRGYAAASKALILYTDADLPFDLQELGRAVRLMAVQEADVLSAYRFDRTVEGFRRTLYTLLYNLLVRVVFGLPVKDVNFSFKLFRRELLERFPLSSQGSFIDAEFLIRAHRSGARIIQIGVDYFPRFRGQSKLASGRVIRRILVELVRFRLGSGS